MASHDLNDLLPRFDLRGMDLGLERMQRAMDELALPRRPRPAIQVAGTNGKGSICSFIGAALQGTRFNVGITTSPHLVSWCERIRVNADLIELPCLRQRLIDQADLHRRHRLTPFEQLLMAAFSHFEQANVDLLVLEVGLGGRLDATTAYPTRPVIAFGNIGLDHREHLGPTLEAIAQEKAAVISSGATVISAAQHPAVAAILESRCREQHAQLHWVAPLPSHWTLGLAGGWQRSNAAVALGALQALKPLGFSVPDEAIRLGFEQVRWPGRLQRARWNGMCLRLDGAHNPPAAEQLAQHIHSHDDQTSQCWILAIQSHKQAIEMLNHLLAPRDQAWIVPVPGHRSWTRDALLQERADWAGQLHDAPSAEAALETLSGREAWPERVPVIAGSLYLIGDLLSRGVLTAE